MAQGTSHKGSYEAQFSAGGQRSARSKDKSLLEVEAEDLTDDEKAEARSKILDGVISDAQLSQKFMLLVILSAAIATLGLLQNSTAVVIGAMLVSPLMGPIMGIGFGLATIESNLIRQSLTTLLAGVALAIVVSLIFIWVSPIQDVTDEIRARTQPNLLDLAVAVVGGIAGVYAIMRNLSGVMVGVSIATALVPPLCTVGFGIATGRLDFSLGAALLFLTNTLAIAFAATIVARVNHFGPSLTPRHTMAQVIGIVVTLGILAIPLAMSLNNIVREVSARSTVQDVLSSELDEKDQIDSLDVSMDNDKVKVDGVVLVDVYDPALSQKLSVEASKELGQEVDVDLVQLRQQSNETEQVVDGFNRRISTLENRDAEASAVAADLMVGNLIDRKEIVIDGQAKLVVVQRNRDQEDPEVGRAMDNIIAAAQEKHPGWLFRTEPLATVTPTGTEAPAPAARPSPGN